MRVEAHKWEAGRGTQTNHGGPRERDRYQATGDKTFRNNRSRRWGGGRGRPNVDGNRGFESIDVHVGIWCSVQHCTYPQYRCGVCCFLRFLPIIMALLNCAQYYPSFVARTKPGAYGADYRGKSDFRWTLSLLIEHP